MSSIFSFQRKLIGLGLGSLLGIFGLNYAFKGDSDKALQKLTSTEIEAEAGEAFILPEADASSSEIDTKKAAPQSPKFPYPDWRKKEDAKIEGGVRTAKLKDFVASFFEKGSQTVKDIKTFGRIRLNWFIKLDMKDRPFFKNKTTIIDWEKIKSEMTKKEFLILSKLEKVWVWISKRSYFF